MIHYTLIHILPVLDGFARGGGGGSGGGGGGSGGGGGGAAGGIFLIGYVIGYFVTKYIKKITPEESSKKVSFNAMIVLTVLGILAIIGLMFTNDPTLVAYAVVWSVLMDIGLWVGWHSSYYGWWERSAEVVKRATLTMSHAAQKDRSWDPEMLKKYTHDTFLQFQRDWSNFDVNSMRQYLMPAYHHHMALVMQALYEMGRQNAVERVVVSKVEPYTVQDHDDDELDVFHMAIEASADDELVDRASGEVIFRDPRSFTEVWKFEREGERWLLTGIDQTTANEDDRDRDLMILASHNDMFYSLDWGWLLLPRKGVLFSDGNFGQSDINNHLIGDYNGVLMQVYTYVPDVQKTMGSGTRYVIGQINLPRSYGGIIVRSRKTPGWGMWGQPKLRGYTEYPMEWQDFNEAYQVLATEPDRLAAFELVNPGFMAYLYDLDANISIEVIDSIVYFYTQEMTGVEAYQKYLGLLVRAHKELQL